MRYIVPVHYHAGDRGGNAGDGSLTARQGMLAQRSSPALNARVESSLACPDCDLLQRVPPLPRGAKARCVRCGHVLASHPPGPRELPLALVIAALISFVLANVMPLMDLSAVGRTTSTTIVGGAYQMWVEGEPIVGALIGFCAVLAPGTYLLFMLILLLAARRTPPPNWVAEMLRWAHHFEMWSMLEVMMLGIMVALIKIAEVAAVEAGIGMYAVFALIVLIPSILVTFDARDLWSRVAWVDAVAPQRGHVRAPAAESGR